MLSVKKDYETLKNSAFTVVDEESGKTHSVLFKGDKLEWSCDCMWSSLKNTPCKHIKAVIEYASTKKSKKAIKDVGV
ncbi:Uncharacterised protein [Candidatus Tiddalikarchaeum anstoanum]|nr:Uncharacterised protein [Candidatus Tiddalikarchaeum anstoanum]